MDAPLFRSTHEAMVFATNFNHEIVPRSTMNQMLAPSTGSGGKGLGGLDGAGTAGIILGEAKRIEGVLAGPSVFARVAPHHKPCNCRSPCCSGKQPNWEWLETIAYIANEIKRIQEDEREPGKRGCVDDPRMRRALVAKFFGEPVVLKKLAEDCELSDNTVASHHGFVQRVLKKAEKEGWSTLDNRLRDLGIVGETE